MKKLIIGAVSCALCCSVHLLLLQDSQESLIGRNTN